MSSCVTMLKPLQRLAVLAFLAWLGVAAAAGRSWPHTLVQIMQKCCQARLTCRQADKGCRLHLPSACLTSQPHGCCLLNPAPEAPTISAFFIYI